MIRFICPVCKANIQETNSGCKCTYGHSFDRAKEGYFNLLLPNSKNSKIPGDNKEMVNARHNFLTLNKYDNLAKEIAISLNDYFPYGITILDAGIGTGYYINSITKIRSNYPDTYCGVDISKFAVKVAARLNPDVECSVSSVYNLPYLDSSFDAITCIFSPYAIDEYKRVLKDDGVLIIASPKEEHLIELRQHLYDNVRNIENNIPIQDLKTIATKEIKYQFSLESNTDILNLLTMTPYTYRAPLNKIDELKKLSSLTLTAHFQITILKKDQY